MSILYALVLYISSIFCPLRVAFAKNVNILISKWAFSLHTSFFLLFGFKCIFEVHTFSRTHIWGGKRFEKSYIFRF